MGVRYPGKWASCSGCRQAELVGPDEVVAEEGPTVSVDPERGREKVVGVGVVLVHPGELGFLIGDGSAAGNAEVPRGGVVHSGRNDVDDPLTGKEVALLGEVGAGVEAEHVGVGSHPGWLA